MKRIKLEKVIISVLIIFVILLSVYFIKNYLDIDEGDKVKVDYSLYVEDKLFQTTIIEDAKLSDLYDEKIIYKPFEFVIGSNSVLKKFEDTIKKMKVGEEKTIELLPSEAYGEFDEKKVIKGLRKEVVINKTSFIDINSFKELFAKEPVLNDFVKGITMPWDIKVVSVNNGLVEVENVLIKGQKIVLPGSSWDSIVEDVSGNSIKIMQSPKIGDTLIIPSDTLLRARVLNVGDETFDVDLNGPLAGKNLKFKIILRDLIKRNNT